MPMPMPAHECSVVPPTWQAAMPVAAVTATASGRIFHLSLRREMISRRRTDFPVPVRARAHAPPLEIVSRTDQRRKASEADEGTHRPSP